MLSTSGIRSSSAWSRMSIVVTPALSITRMSHSLACGAKPLSPAMMPATLVPWLKPSCPSGPL